MTFIEILYLLSILIIGFGIVLLICLLPNTDYIDLNFKGYTNLARTTDTELPRPAPLNKKCACKNKNSLKASEFKAKIEAKKEVKSV